MLQRYRRARLPLETNRGRRVIFVSSSEADERGHYTLRLPYSNRDGPASIRSAGEYELRSAGQQARAVIREIDVLDGLVVAGPDFAAE